jgi:hypothetical protein
MKKYDGLDVVNLMELPGYVQEILRDIFVKQLEKNDEKNSNGEK